MSNGTWTCEQFFPRPCITGMLWIDIKRSSPTLNPAHCWIMFLPFLDHYVCNNNLIRMNVFNVRNMNPLIENMITKFNMKMIVMISNKLITCG